MTVLTELGPQPVLGSPPRLPSTVEIDLDEHCSTNITYHVDPGLSVMRAVAIPRGRGGAAWSICELHISTSARI